MKKKLLLFILLISNFISVENCYTQNLISNGSFENCTSLPTSISDISMVKNWTSPSTATPDYFNANAIVPDVMVPDNYFGSQPAHSGNAYCGLIMYSSNPAFPNYEYREYLQQHLTAPLSAGSTYYFEFYVSRAGGNLQHYGTDKIGIYFSANAVSANSSNHINVTPDYEYPTVISDSDNWTKVSGCYTAGGAIEYVTIGNFRDNNNLNALPILPVWPGGVTRSYYYIDDVSLTALKVDFDFDNAVCNADVTFSNKTSFAGNYVWTFADGSTDTAANPIHHYSNPGSYDVKLTATSNQQCSDSVVKTIEIKNVNHHLYIPDAFTPNNDGLNDYFEIKQSDYCQPIHCSIYNRWGQKIFDQSAYQIKWNGEYHSENAAQGVYFYIVEEGKEKYSGNIALIR